MKYRYRVLVFLFFLSLITFIDRVCISVVGKTMQDDLGLSPTQWGWMLGLFSLAYGLLEIPAGMLGDRIGPRRVLTRIVGCWSVFTVLTGFVTSYWQLLIVRTLFGAGEAGAFPNASATISRWFPALERARAQGVVFMASRIGGALTPLLTIPILYHYGWRACFFIFGLAGLLWPLIWYFWFRDNPADKSGITKEEVAEIGFRPGAAGAHAGIQWKLLFRQPNLWWLMAMYFANCWTAFFYLGWLHTFLERGRDFDRGDLMALSWLPFVLGATANILGGVVSDMLSKRVGLRWGRRLVGLGGLGAASVFLAFAFFTQDKLLTVIFLGLAYAGTDFMMPAAWATCLDIGGKHAGTVSGAMNMAGQMGAFWTSIVFGYIVTMTGSYNAPLIPMTVITILAALMWLKIDPQKPVEHSGQ